MLEFRPWTGGCPERHARGDRTQLTRGSDDGLMIYVYGNLRGGHRLRCRRCGRTTSDIPAKFAKQLTMTADLDLVRVNRCITYGPCEVSDCNRDGVERHHF